MPKKAVKSKDTNPIKSVKSRASSDTMRNSKWLEDYKDLITFKMYPVTDAMLERLADELTKWALKEDSLTVSSFCRIKGITKKTLYRWKDRCADLDAAYNFALEQFAERREVGGLTRKFDPTFAFNSLPMYDSEWKAFVEWKANLRKENENDKKIVVELSNISSKLSISHNQE